MKSINILGVGIILLLCSFLTFGLDLNSLEINSSGIDNRYSDNFGISFNITGSEEPVNITTNWYYTYSGFLPTEDCKQDSAIISSSCGGLSNGSYYFSGNWESPDYSGANKCLSNDCFMYINYSKPSKINFEEGSYWKINFLVNGTYDVTLDSSCWNYRADLLSLRVNSSYKSFTTDKVTFSCYNGTVWNDLIYDTVDIFGGDEFHWNVSNANFGAENISCYQESANISTVCGGLNSGIYSFTNAGNDGNYSTYSGSTGVFYINYTLPIGALYDESSWYIESYKYVGIATTSQDNLTIDETCWDVSGKLIFRINNTLDDIQGLDYFADCYNGTNWVNLLTLNEGATASWALVDEAMYWGFNNNINEEVWIGQNTTEYIDSLYLSSSDGTLVSKKFEPFSYIMASLSITNGSSYFNFNSTWLKLINEALNDSSVVSSGTTALSPVNEGGSIVFNLNGYDLEGDDIRLKVCSNSGSNWTTCSLLCEQLTSVTFNAITSSSINCSYGSSGVSANSNIAYFIAYDGYNYSSYNTNYFVNHNSSIENITFIPSPAETTDDLSFTFDINDRDGDITYLNWTKFFINDVEQISLENVTFISSGNTSLGDNVTLQVKVYDGFAWSEWTNSSALTIGDSLAPNISNFDLSSNSGSNDASFIAYVDVTDINSIANVYLEVTNPNSEKTNYSMSLAYNDTYSRSYSPSTDGVYAFRVFAIDGSNNEAVLSPSSTYTDTTIVSGGGGGGGGGSSTTPKVDCNIDYIPPVIELSSFSSLRLITIENKESTSVTPSYNLLDSNLVLESPPSTILGNSESKLGISVPASYVQSLDDDVKTLLIVSFDKCNDLNIPITILGGKTTISEFALPFFDVGIRDYLEEPVGKVGTALRDKAPFLTVGLIFIIISLIYYVSTLGTVVESFKEKKIIRLVLLLIFGIPASGVITVLLISIFRGLI